MITRQTNLPDISHPTPTRPDRHLLLVARQDLLDLCLLRLESRRRGQLCVRCYCMTHSG